MLPLTCVVMKCFKKIILNMIKSKISSSLDPHQFVNSEGCYDKYHSFNKGSIQKIQKPMIRFYLLILILHLIVRPYLQAQNS